VNRKREPITVIEISGIPGTNTSSWVSGGRDRIICNIYNVYNRKNVVTPSYAFLKNKILSQYELRIFDECSVQFSLNFE
jgi:hypothetical protein